MAPTLHADDASATLVAPREISGAAAVRTLAGNVAGLSAEQLGGSRFVRVALIFGALLRGAFFRTDLFIFAAARPASSCPAESRPKTLAIDVKEA